MADGTRRGGNSNRGELALGLTVLVVIVVAAVVIGGGFLGNGVSPSPTVAPSAVAVAPQPTSVAVTPPAVASSPAATAAPAGTPAGTPGPPLVRISPGLIAVIGDDGALSTMDDAGGSLVSYPAPGITFGFPAWSPDGTRIAAIGTGPDDTAIYVFTVPGGGGSAAAAPSTPAIGPEPVVIFRSADRVPFYLYWTPDSRHVSFLASEGSDLTLRVAPADGSAPLDGSGPASLVRQGSPLYFDWINSTRLLVHIDVGPNAFTGEVGLDGAALRPVLDGSGLFRSASASADGRYVAYVKGTADGTENIVVQPRAGGASHQLPVFGPAAFVFDPAGDAVASLASTQPVTPDASIPVGPIKFTDPATGKTRTLLAGPAVAFFWSPDGRTIAAILPGQPGDDQVTREPGIQLAAAAGSLDGPITVATAPGITGRLAFIDVASGTLRSQQVVHLGQHFVDELLPYFDQYALSHHLWSPDSASLLLPEVAASGADQLVVVPAAGSDPRPIPGGVSGFWSP